MEMHSSTHVQTHKQKEDHTHFQNYLHCTI